MTKYYVQCLLLAIYNKITIELEKRSRKKELKTTENVTKK